MHKCGDCTYYVSSEKEIGSGICRQSPPAVATVPAVGGALNIMPFYPPIPSHFMACGCFLMKGKVINKEE